MKTYSIYLAVILGLVVATLAWIADARLEDLRRYHQSIARESTAASANEIARFVAEKKRLVGIFADENRALVAGLAADPENAGLHDALQQRIALYFPDYFSFTVTDGDGEPFMIDFDGFIGDLCRTDLRAFAGSGRQSPRIHPHSEAYHFDVLAPFRDGARNGILFISFHADILGDALRASQTPGHRLLLIDPASDQLIEASALGARIRLERDDYRLDAGETARILQREKVPGTAWDVVDLHEPGLFRDYGSKLVFHSLLILLLFSVISLSLLLLVRREERLRRIAERHKDDFLSVVSHELRTPLTSIRGSLGMIAGGKTGALNDQTLALAAIATRNCERLAALVDDLLDLRRIEAGKLTLNRQPLAIGELVEQSLKANEGYAATFGVSYRLRPPAGEFRVEADEDRILQVMANLLSNAAKYGGERDAIEVSIEPGDSFVRVAVTDHGNGVPAGVRARVFDKFVQHDASSVRKVGGTGLGLNIVRHIVELHGGRVGFDSADGVGSTFYFELPVMA